MRDFLAEKGIVHQVSYVESPEQNGRVERKHQYFLSIARALIHQSNAPKIFWTYAVVLI
jgi:hypothetical protein